MLILGTAILNESSLHKRSLFLSQELIRLRSRKVDNNEVRRDGSHHGDGAFDDKDPAPSRIRANTRDLYQAESENIREPGDRCGGREEGRYPLL